MISAVAALGAFVAVPITGSVVVGRGPVGEGLGGRIPLVVAVGLSIWSAPLLGLLILKAYRPEAIGIAGWIAVALWVAIRRPSFPPITIPRPSALILAVGLLIAGILYAAAPSEPLAGGRDMAVYANHAAYMVNHGMLDIPYPAGLGTGEDLPPGWIGFSGVYTTQPTLTVQFAHVFPAWLAQASAVAGHEGLLRLNVVFAVLSALAVFAVARIWMPAYVAVFATLFLAFNPGQVWVARNTLTEMLTQLLIWCAFLLILSPNQERPRAAAAWAGFLLGMSAVVRIDSLVILPLAIAGHTLVRLLAGRRPTTTHTSIFYLAALPTFALAIGYYIAFSNPYFSAHGSYLWPIAAAGVAAVLAWGLTLVPAIWARAAKILAMRRTLVVASVAVIAVAAFAYFVRPLLEPFDLIPRPVPVPPRSHIEDAMRNLGAYLTPVALWMAIIAWLATTVTAVHRITVRPVPVLVIIGGFSALYFWNQAITPDHFWAIRRFVPLIMPAAVLFAGVAGAFVLGRMPRAWRLPAFGVAVLALAVNTWRLGTPMYFVAERAGVYSALANFADHLPPGLTYLAPMGKKSIQTAGTALFMTFDQDLLPIALDAEGGRDEAIARLRTASPEHPVPVIASLREGPSVFVGDTLAQIEVPYDTMVSTPNPVPQVVTHDEIGLVARMVSGVDLSGLELGASAHWLVEQDGYFPAEFVGDHVARWTDGNAEMRFPTFSGTDPEELSIDLETTGPLGASVEITYNSSLLFAGDLPPGPWHGTFALPRDPALGDEVTVELDSTTFVPAETIAGSGDVRRLGIMVRSIQLLGPDA
jgi:hypothetical protein